MTDISSMISEDHQVFNISLYHSYSFRMKVCEQLKLSLFIERYENYRKLTRLFHRSLLGPQKHFFNLIDYIKKTKQVMSLAPHPKKRCYCQDLATLLVLEDSQKSTYKIHKSHLLRVNTRDKGNLSFYLTRTKKTISLGKV